ncbi:energy-coupling factor ABC transporter permease [Alkalibaculum sp. M08DMB]|uniref:Cobalt transport protein CbiM n=2 Tax=Alkalibaculum sporogenes TaxID=2655001 RepID=A0A6A7K9X3_9FIRM|nr:energy-coupling factor ABC transporter permease [Alkalibaculum sporogenes]
MHIMEGFLPKGWAVFWTLITIPFFILGIRKLNSIFKNQPNKKLLVALAGAFVFLLSALKIPSVAGSCSHPTGVGLGAIMFGPTIMTVIGVIVLLFQALLLAHGGITTLGANAFSMAVVGPFVSFGIFMILRKRNVNIGVSVFFASALGSLCTYIVTSIQLGLAFPDPVGGVAASLVKFLGIFAITQIPISTVEGIITALVYDKIKEYEGESILNEKIN